MRTKQKKQYTIIDLFAGAGGLSEGFIQAGFYPIAHVEMDKDACSTLKTRCCYHYLYAHGQLSMYHQYLKGEISRDTLYGSVPADIINSVINAEISDSTIDSIFQQIKKLAQNKKIDFIIGGPPCQAYSLLGRHKKDMDNDPRTLLYLQYGKFLKEFSPRGFVFENVPGLLSSKKGEHFKNLQMYFRELGYNVYFKMLNASNYGVIQDRHRLIIVGWKQDEDFGYPDIQTTELTATINDLLYDLPNLKAGEVQQISCYSHSTNQYLLESGIRLSDDTFVTQNIARSLNSNDANIYAYAIKLWNENGVRVKYTDLPAEYKTQKNEKSFLDRFKVVDGNGKSHTIVAHLSKDGHYYIHPSLDCCRSISVREAARIQSFPDNFYFEGSRSAMYKQIGNAVPPLMAKAIAESIKQIMQNKKTIIK